MAAILIRQFDIFRNTGRNSKAYPLMLVLQADAASDGRSVVAAPMVARDDVPASRLTPIIACEEEEWSLLVPELAPVFRSKLRAWVGNAEQDRRVVIAAIDFLFTGV